MREKLRLPDDEENRNMGRGSNKTDSNDLFDVWPCGSCMVDVDGRRCGEEKSADLGSRFL
jgi:hypothetical protein